MCIVLWAVASGPNATAEPSPATPVIVRLPPAGSMKLPAAFVRELQADGCTVPQPVSDATNDKVDHVISGSFARRGQRDYAVLCSQNGTSHIRVHWGGRSRCASRIEYGRDLDQLTDRQDGGLGHGRAIDAASQKTTAFFRNDLGGARPPDGTHDGIQDADLGKASVIWSCAGGVWTPLRGMD